MGVDYVLDFQRNVVGICAMGSFGNGLAYLGMQLLLQTRKIYLP